MMNSYLGLGNEFKWDVIIWVDTSEFTDVLEVTSFDENDCYVSSHKNDVRGVQFHPESVLTPNGKKILEIKGKSLQPSLKEGDIDILD
jgi:anthranilate synthase component 2